jgi:hypothetical protein
MAREQWTRCRFVAAGDLAENGRRFDGIEVRGPDDEDLGDVEGFIVDEPDGRLRYVVIDSGGWFTGGTYLIPPAYTRIDQDRAVLRADLTRDTIERFPEFDRERYPQISGDDLWRFEQRIITAFGGDSAVVAPTADWDRASWPHYEQPDWWRPSYVQAGSTRSAAIVDREPLTDRGLRRDEVTTRTVRDDVARERRLDRDQEPDEAARRTGPVANADLEAVERGTVLGRDARDVEPDRTFQREAGTTSTGNWPDPRTERAQPGDVLGIERGGETTRLGETAEDEDKRREAAERDARESQADLERERREKR